MNTLDSCVRSLLSESRGQKDPQATERCVVRLGREHAKTTEAFQRAAGARVVFQPENMFSLVSKLKIKFN